MTDQSVFFLLYYFDAIGDSKTTVHMYTKNECLQSSQITQNNNLIPSVAIVAKWRFSL